MFMRRVVARILSSVALIGIVALPAASLLQAQAAPKGSTGKCADGTFTSAKTKAVACASQAGVAPWFADKPAKPSKPSAPAAAPASAPAPPAAKEHTSD